MASSSAAAVFRSAFGVVVVVLSATIMPAEQTCTEDQVQSCRHAASTDQWNQLPASGQCVVKQYVHYTHLCTVSNYEPGLDYCCCHVTDGLDPDRLFCCRYHQDWYHFRCTESTDDISGTDESRDRRGSSLFAREVALPVGVCVVVVVLLVGAACYARGHCSCRHRMSRAPCKAPPRGCTGSRAVTSPMTCQYFDADYRPADTFKSRSLIAGDAETNCYFDAGELSPRQACRPPHRLPHPVYRHDDWSASAALTSYPVGHHCGDRLVPTAPALSACPMPSTPVGSPQCFDRDTRWPVRDVILGDVIFDDVASDGWCAPPLAETGYDYARVGVARCSVSTDRRPSLPPPYCE